LVGEHDRREDGAFPKLEAMSAVGGVLDDRGTENVRRHQVGGELYAREGDVESLGQGAHHERLAEPRDTFEQHMGTGHERNEHSFHDLVLTDDDSMELALEATRQLLEPLDLLLSIEFGRHEKRDSTDTGAQVTASCSPPVPGAESARSNEGPESGSRSGLGLSRRLPPSRCRTLERGLDPPRP